MRGITLTIRRNVESPVEDIIPQHVDCEPYADAWDDVEVAIQNSFADLLFFDEDLLDDIFQ